MSFPSSQKTIKSFLSAVFGSVFRVEVKGMEHFPAEGERVVIVSNHQSFVDAALIAAFQPGDATFAVDTDIARRWWVRPVLRFVDHVTVDPTSPYATKTLINAAKAGSRIAIFPEGRLSVTGGLMKAYDGTSMIAEKSGSKILPIRIDGADFSKFSRLKGKVPQRWFPKITLTAFPPTEMDVPEDVKGKARRRAMGNLMQDTLADTCFQTKNIDRTLFDALLDTRKVYGGSMKIVSDAEKNVRTYDDLVTRSVILGRRIAPLTESGEIVGVMLPNTVACATTFFSLHVIDRIPAMINFSAGSEAIGSCCLAAGVKTVLTSRRFVEKGKLDKVVAALGEQVKFVFLEDLGDGVTAKDKMSGKLASYFPHRFAKREAKPDDIAVVLFTSGSEGAPKGVALSHRNILANCAQVSSVLSFTMQDRVLNAMPMFHAFGITGGFLLPVLGGIPVSLYPSPLHYKNVTESVYGTNSTIIFGTDTFYKGYARVAHAYDFQSVRMAIGGAEKVQEETRRIYADRFGVRIFEGYGATETAPVLCLNTPLFCKSGSVGKFVPGIESTLEPISGIETGGLLRVKGPNIMRGYFKVERPGVLQPPADGWYDTGDVVRIDPEGFVFFQDRTKRIANIGGEKVSLTSVENLASGLWSEDSHAAVTIPDDRKGEQIVLVTTCPAAERKDLSIFARTRGTGEIYVPRHILHVEKMPILGTGKTDYVTVKKIVEAALVQSAAA